jgi:hypothetical protein
MGDALRRVFLTIGIALGLAEGRPDPALYARIVQDQEGYVALNARVEGAFVPEALELVQTGSSVALRFEAALAGKAGRSGGGAATASTRSVRYDLRSSRYVVDFLEEGRTSSVIDPSTATGLVSAVQGLRVCPLGALGEGGRVAVSVSVGIVDSSGSWRAAPVLWNYTALKAEFSFGSPAEVPR